MENGTRILHEQLFRRCTFSQPQTIPSSLQSAPIFPQNANLFQCSLGGQLAPEGLPAVFVGGSFTMLHDKQQQNKSSTIISTSHSPQQLVGFCTFCTIFCTLTHFDRATESNSVIITCNLHTPSSPINQQATSSSYRIK